MTYLTVKNGIAAIIKKLGYKESEQVFDFDSQGENEYGNKFILHCNGASNSTEDEGIVGKYDDEQEWELLIAYKKSARGLQKTYDDMHKKRELLIRDLDDWANTQSFIIKLRYESFEVDDLDNYFVLRIKLIAIDRITY